MNVNPFKTRYAVLYAFALFFIIASALLRITFIYISFGETLLTLASSAIILFKGLVFDFGVVLYFSILYSIYLLVLPQRFNRSGFNKVFSFAMVFLMILFASFSFFAEFTFWREFESRFNFIAVDYLVYTYEVVNNINESYPLPYLISAVAVISLFVLWLFIINKKFQDSFNSNSRFKYRLIHTVVFGLLVTVYILFIDNSWAERGRNRYQNELVYETSAKIV